MGEIFPEQPTGQGKPAWLRFEVLLEASDALASQECSAFHDGMLEEMAVVRGWRYYDGTQSDVGFEAERKTVELPEIDDPLDRYQTRKEYQVSYREEGRVAELPDELIAAAKEQGVEIPVPVENIPYTYKFDLVYGEQQGIGWGETRAYRIEEVTDRPRPPKRVSIHLDQGGMDRYQLQAMDEDLHTSGMLRGNEQDVPDYVYEPALKRVWQGLMIVKAFERKGQPLVWKSARPEA